MKYLLTHFPRNSLVLGTVPSTDFTCKSRFIQAETMENILKDCADKIISVANTIGSVTGSAKMAETLSMSGHYSISGQKKNYHGMKNYA